MIKLDIKPMSQNKAYRRKRYKSKAYKAYEKELLWTLPAMEIPKGKLELKIVWGFSNVLSDNTNPLKPFEDVLQKRYGFNDRQVYKCTIEKQVVKKGNEFIEFEIKEYLTKN